MRFFLAQWQRHALLPGGLSASLLIALALIVGCFYARADTINLADSSQRLSIGSVLTYFLDDSGQLSLDAAMRDPRYRKADGTSLVLGYRSAALWVRFTVDNPGTIALERWLQLKPERLGQVGLFLPAGDGHYQRLDNGRQLPLSQRPIATRGIVFPLWLAPGQTQTLYLRIQSRTPLALLPTLWQPEAFRQAMQREDLLVMLSLGALLGLAGYALLLYPLQRDRAALFLGLEMLFVALFETSYNGYGHTYLFPHHPGFSWWLAPLAGLLAQLTFNRFIKTFLPLSSPDKKPIRLWLDGLLLADLLLLLRHCVQIPAGVPGPVLPLLILTANVSMLIIGVIERRRGYRPAQLIVIGMSLGMAVNALRIGAILGWLPFLPVFSPVVNIAAVFLANLFYFAAISQRVDLLRREKDSAQTLAFNAQKQAAERLESEVAARTAELNAAKHRAEQADRAKGDFMARVSHELRTPLHTILGYTALLLRDAEDNKTRERLGLLENGGHHLLGLIEELLDYARSERNQLQLQPAPTALHRLLTRIDEHGKTLAVGQQNRYQSHHGTNLPVAVHVDERRLEQALLIFLSNAARYTSNGSIILNVAAEAATPGWTHLRFDVIDTGIGIAASDYGRIFEPFERVNGNGKANGLGLGLPIAKQIIQTLGAQIDVDSQVGTGSRFGFAIDLPLADISELAIATHEPDILGYAGPTRRFLVLDDTEEHRRFLEHLLSDLGFEVRCAASVHEARAQLATELFDLALLDQWLPDGTAYDLLADLQHTQPHTPAILISATPPTPPPGLNPALAATLPKPVTASELIATIGQTLALNWLTADNKSNAPSLPAVRRPTPESLAELVALVETGAVYDIEAWLRHANQTEPDCSDWLTLAEEHLKALDFKGLIKLASS